MKKYLILIVISGLLLNSCTMFVDNKELAIERLSRDSIRKADLLNLYGQIITYEARKGELPKSLDELNVDIKDPIDGEIIGGQKCGYLYELKDRDDKYFKNISGIIIREYTEEEYIMYNKDRLFKISTCLESGDNHKYEVGTATESSKKVPE